MEKFCQSCGMPLTATNRGTNADGSLSSEYCHLCYQRGAFTQPQITLAEMKREGLAGINKDPKMNGIKKFMIKLTYGPMLKRLKRWR
ncbi:zinc ribbon domain-containing protein [Levilactobacillus bambusae]|uniref:Putative zinc ribbon domain-containing protein n=1 Tax=Levilactobacillus bambusae TaxID=2024736 RepID=A0A2V1N104_9LACO|nr:zinc ribbon domain-containing protein [Levilactobacillus bambusae]PWG00428.1 hypothetical protein DCM90_05750 [Levilactobacillus bambusae]